MVDLGVFENLQSCEPVRLSNWRLIQIIDKRFSAAVNAFGLVFEVNATTKTTTKNVLILKLVTKTIQL